jgi:hypothetical protein
MAAALIALEIFCATLVFIRAIREIRGYVFSAMKSVPPSTTHFKPQPYTGPSAEQVLRCANSTGTRPSSIMLADRDREEDAWSGTTPATVLMARRYRHG